MHPCLHKIIVQPLAVFRRSPSPFNSVWRDGALSSYPRQTRHKDETRGNSRRESAESEESPSLIPTPLWFLGRLSVAPLLLSRRMLRKNQSHDYFFFFLEEISATSIDSIGENRPRLRFYPSESRPSNPSIHLFKTCSSESIEHRALNLKVPLSLHRNWSTSLVAYNVVTKRKRNGNVTKAEWNLSRSAVT